VRLKLRYYRSEGTIRSIGNPPNGILVVDAREGRRASWAIDSSMEPESPGMGGPLAAHEQRAVMLAAPNVVAEVDTESVVCGCDNVDTGRMLIAALVVAIRGSADLLNRSPLGIEVVESVVELARETVDAACDRGWA